MNSFNHYSLGAVGAWMYRYMLGIRRGKNGWQKFRSGALLPGSDLGGRLFRKRIRRDSGRLGKEGRQDNIPGGSARRTQAEVILPGRREIIGSGAHEFQW